MKLSTLMVINAVVALVFGIAFVLAPAQTGSLYGVTADAPLEYVAQLMGAAFIGFGVLAWLASHVAESGARRAIVLALLVNDAIGFVVALIRQLGGAVNAFGWLNVAIYLLLAWGFAYFQFAKPGES